MKEKIIIRNSVYYDSVKLMLVTQSIKSMEGIIECAIVMATPLNKETLVRTNFMSETIENATPSDMIIAIRAENDSIIESALSDLDNKLNATNSSSTSEYRPRSIDSAVKIISPNVCIISVPGNYAYDLSMEALKKSMNILLFSDNVSIEEELKLKQYSTSKDLLLMGPDCGTAIINQVPLGFANSVKQGNVGIIAASGTGLQELCVLLDRFDTGIYQAIGTGGRDLSDEIGGLTMLQALKALNKDDNAHYILITSKPPSDCVAKEMIDYIKEHVQKPVVINFLGKDYKKVLKDEKLPEHIFFETYLEDAALTMVQLANQLEVKPSIYELDQNIEEKRNLARKKRSELSPERIFIKGLYSGGTLNSESFYLMKDEIEISSNSSKDPEHKINDVYHMSGNAMIDLGDDQFTVGRAHPMIDPTLRAELFEKELQNNENAVILMDIVLGYGANRKPLDEFLKILKKHPKDSRPIIIVYVLGTDGDPQNIKEIQATLEKEDVIVMPSNKSAAQMALNIIKGEL